MEARHVIHTDITWVMGMLKTHYPELYQDENGIKEWLEYIIQEPNVLFLRNEAAIVFGLYDRLFWNGQLCGEIRILAGKARPLVRLMNVFKKIGEVNNLEWDFRSITKFNLKKLAKLVGAEEGSPTYTWRIA